MTVTLLIRHVRSHGMLPSCNLWTIAHSNIEGVMYRLIDPISRWMLLLRAQFTLVGNMLRITVTNQASLCSWAANITTELGRTFHGCTKISTVNFQQARPYNVILSGCMATINVSYLYTTLHTQWCVRLLGAFFSYTLTGMASFYRQTVFIEAESANVYQLHLHDSIIPNYCCQICLIA